MKSIKLTLKNIIKKIKDMLILTSGVLMGLFLGYILASHIEKHLGKDNVPKNYEWSSENLEVFVVKVLKIALCVLIIILLLILSQKI